MVKVENTSIDYKTLLEYRKNNDYNKSKSLKRELKSQGVDIFDVLAYRELSNGVTEIYFVSTTKLLKAMF